MLSVLLISTYETAVQKNLELIKVQEELRVLNENLEEKVRERTNELVVEVIERKKIEDDPRTPIFLQTVRGVGYMLVPD